METAFLTFFCYFCLIIWSTLIYFVTLYQQLSQTVGTEHTEKTENTEKNTAHNPSPHSPTAPHSLSPTLPRREGDETPEKRRNLKTQPSKFNLQNSTLKIQPSKFNPQNSTLKIQPSKFNLPKAPFTQILLVQILKITTIKHNK